MAKKFKYRISLLCCSLIGLLGFGGCKSSKPVTNEPSPAERLKQQMDAAEMEGADVARDLQQTQDAINSNEKIRRDLEIRPVVYGPRPGK